MTDRIRIRRTTTVGKVPTTLDLQEGELGLNTIDKKLYSSDGTSVFEIGNTIKSYSSLNTDITSLISGTTSGNLFEGITSGHFVIGIKSNDAQDGFHILDKGNATSSNTDPYLNRLFSVSRSLGVSTTLPVSAPSFSGNGALLTNLNASSITTGSISDSVLSSNVVLLNNTQTVTGAKTFSAVTTISNTTASNSTTTGALIVGGGVGVSGAIFANTVSANSYNLIPVGRGAGGVSVNTAVGVGSLQSNTTGDYCSAFGIGSLQANTTGINCSAFGAGSFQASTTGSNCSAFGVNAGRLQPNNVTALTVTNNSCFFGAFTKGTQNATNENVFGFSATGNGSNTVTIGDNNIINTYLKGIVNTDLLISSKGIKIGGSFYPSYETNIDFLNDPANTWRRLVSVVCPSITFSTIGFCIEIIDPMGNHALTNTVHTIKKETYYVACVRTASTTFDSPDACYVTGPSDRIRAVKTSIGNYEVQIQSDNTNREYRLSICVYASNGNHTVNYYAGDTASVGIAQYDASVSATAREDFQNVSIKSSTASTSTTTGALTVSGGVGVSGRVTAQELSATNLLYLDSKGTYNNIIEIGSTGGFSTTPAIDFHSGITPVDFDARIIATGGNGTTGKGSLNFTANNFTFSGLIYSSGIIRDPISTTGTLYLTSGIGTAGTGAVIQLFGSTHGTYAGQSFLDTSIFNLRSLDGTVTYLTVNSSEVNILGRPLVLTAGTTTIQPLRLQTGVNLTTPVFGSVEFDGTNLYLTNNSTTPTRKTIAFTDSPIGNASTATTLQTARTIALSGGATGTATSFNGSANITIPVTDLNATNLTSGTVANARISGAYTGLTNLTGTGTVTFTRFQATGLSTNWGVTSGINTGGLNVAMGTSTAATWLLSGTSGEVFRYGIQGLDSGNFLRFYAGANDFYFNNNILYANAFSGSGASLTSLNASNLASGTIPDARITGAYSGITSLSLTGPITVANQGELRLSELTANGTNYVALRSPANVAANIALTLPATLGTNGQVLATDASGNLSWANNSADNLGNHTATTTLNMNGQVINAASAFYLSNNHFSITNNAGGTNISLGTTANSEYGVSSIEIPTHTTYGGTNNDHTGVKLASGGMSGWGTAQFQVYTSTDWKTYSAVPCFSVTNNIATVSSGVLNGVYTNYGSQSIELGMNSTISYIDFHSNGTSTGIDFDARIACTGYTGGSGGGNLGIQSNILTITATTTVINSKVGIGTSGPATKLHVVGSGITLENNGYTPLTLTNTGKTTAGLSTNYVLYNMAAGNAGGTGQNGFHIYSYNGSNTKSIPFTILDNDNVGIGTVSPSQRLHVSGGALISSLAGTGSRMVVADAAGVLSTSALPVSSNLYTADGTLASNRMVTMGANSLTFFGSIPVTFNNTTPTATANAPSLAAARLSRTGTHLVSWQQVVDFAIGKYKSGSEASTQLDIKMNNGNTPDPDVTVMSILGNGNVGIGTTAPAYKLHVSGWGYFTGPTSGDKAARIGLLGNEASTIWWVSGNVNNTFAIHQNGIGDRLIIDTNGAVSIQGTVGIGGTINAPLYRTNGTTNGAVGIASGACVNTNAQMELTVPSYSNNTVHISFHKPGIFAANFGLDSDNQFAFGGWSSGNGYTGIKAGAGTFTGTVTATTFSGSGASLTSLNASNLSSGTIPDARLSGTYTGLTNLTGSGTVTFNKYQATGLSSSWGVTSGVNTGGLNTVMGTSTAATWLLSGTSGGVFRYGIQGLDSGNFLRFYAGANNFYFNNDILYANAFSGSGASLTSLNASNLTSGTIPNARITGAYDGITTLSQTGLHTITVAPGGNGILLDANLAADATNTLRDAPNLLFRSKYWNGTANINYDARLNFDITAPGEGKFTFDFGAAEKASISSSGNISATSFTGSGSSLTSLNASNLSSGTIPDGRLSGSYSGIDNYACTNVNGNGFRLWNSSDNFKIYMSASTDGTWGGRLDTTSDYNMYFRMSSGTNRGFVFMNNTTPAAQIDAAGVFYGSKLRLIASTSQITLGTTSSTTNNRKWDLNVFTDGILYFQTKTDADTWIANAASISRTGVITCTSVTTTSDERVKDNITQIDNASDITKQLQPCKYNHYINNRIIDGNIVKGDTYKTTYGFIAQELIKTLPEAVYKPSNENELYGLDYTVIIPILTKAIQEQQDQINILQTTVSVLMKKLHNIVI